MTTSSLIADVNVVDVRDGTVTTHQDVHVTDGIISSISGTAGAAGRGEQRLDRPGAYLVPGFVDMHAHPLNGKTPDTRALALMLAHGVTGFRQMAGSPQLLQDRRNGSLALGRYAPELLALPGSLLTALNAGTPAAAVAEVGRQAAAGADFVKAALITPDVYFPAQSEANRLGIPLLGHLPTGVDVRAASAAGFVRQ